MMIVMKMKTRWQTQAAPARKSISYTLLLIYNHGEEIVERLIWGNNQQATQQQESFTFLYNDSLKKQGNYSLRRPPKLIIPQAVIRHWEKMSFCMHIDV